MEIDYPDEICQAILKVSEELSSMEILNVGIYYHIDKYRFQKNLVVWKFVEVMSMTKVRRIVSEELSSMEIFLC